MPDQADTAKPANPQPDLLAVAIGNTRLRAALFRGGELERSFAARHDRPGDLHEQLQAFGLEPDQFHIALATVSPSAADDFEAAVQTAGLRPRLTTRVGEGIPIPIAVAVPDPARVGHDRLLNALAAYQTAQQACVVIDAGTAITVDFVDGEGTFHGGVIAPGLAMGLRALHENTAALPLIEVTEIQPDPLGRDTESAMRLGVVGAARGLVRYQLEQVSDMYGAYPQVVATGGDAALLFEDDGVVEHLVPDLQLMGIRAAVDAALVAGADEE